MKTSHSSKALLAATDEFVDDYFKTTTRALNALYKSWAGNPAMQKAVRSVVAKDVASGELGKTLVDAFSAVSPEARAAFARVPANAAEMFARMYGMDMELNARLWSSQYAGSRITAIQQTSIQSVQQYLTAAFTDRVPIESLTRDIFNVVRLDPRWVRATISHWEGLQQRGVTTRQAKMSQTRYLDRAATIKSRMIARTETQTAANVGHYQSLRAAQQMGLLEVTDKLQWIAAPGCCPQCVTYNGVTAPLSVGFATLGVSLPPLHPNCRCTIGLSA